MVSKQVLCTAFQSYLSMTAEVLQTIIYLTISKWNLEPIFAPWDVDIPRITSSLWHFTTSAGRVQSHIETKQSETAWTISDISNSYDLKCSLELSVCGQLYIIPVSPADIQTATQWNLIGCSTTASPPMSSPSSIFPSFHLIAACMSARKNSAHLSKV
jgi:hypothetical protein